MTLRFGFKTAQMHGLYNEGMLEGWLAADELGFDTCWAHDHLLNQNDTSTPEEEGWTILSALLAQTKRVKGGLLTGCNTFRHPAVVAKMATTVDRISGGRCIVGMGAGWMVDEHEQHGIELGTAGQRLRMLDEACQVMKALWTQERSTFAGQYYQLNQAYHEPKPIQKPYPWLLIGGKGEKVTLRITATHADEWNFSGGTVEEFAHKNKVLDEHCAAIGRDPATLARSAQFGPPAWTDAESLAEQARAFAKAGATHLIFQSPKPFSGDAARWVWDEVVRRI
jgi:F420-dependent oxidoreductase-like protein